MSGLIGDHTLTSATSELEGKLADWISAGYQTVMRPMRAALVMSLMALGSVRAQPGRICAEPHLDIDGDGAIDSFEEIANSRGTGGAVYRVHHGLRIVGEIDACAIRAAHTSSHGLFDLVGVWRLGAGEAIETRWRFDGRCYRRASSRRCASESCN